MELTMELLPVSRVAEPVEIGTSLPTIRVATSLSTTTTDGFDSTLVVVTACKASRTTFGVLSEPIIKLKPGNARLRAAPTRPFAVDDSTPGGDDGMLDILPSTPLCLLLRKNCTPYLRSSLSVTSATVESIATWSFGRSSCARVRATIW